VVGQAVAARTSLNLLAYRAAEAEKGKAPWPEFAESDCFTCHADLGNKSWRRNADYYKGRTPGHLPYSRWYSAMLPALAPPEGGPKEQGATRRTELDRMLEQLLKGR